jgi:hypothetical protein
LIGPDLDLCCREKWITQTPKLFFGQKVDPIDQDVPEDLANYENYSCEQLAQEGQRVSARAAEAAGVQDKNRTKDTVKTTVGVILFWPILFANEGNGQTAAELASLNGQKKAIKEASIRKNCGIRFQQGDERALLSK